MENCEKCAEKITKKRKIAQILLKSQSSAQECWKCKKNVPNSKKWRPIAQRNQNRPSLNHSPP